MEDKNKKIKIPESLSKLEDIVMWFEKQKNVDVEEGLKLVREGATLIKSLRARLQEIDNEFQEIKKEIEH